MTSEADKTPEWILEFRRKAWALEARFLETERETFQKLAYERQRQTQEALEKAKPATQEGKATK